MHWGRHTAQMRSHMQDVLEKQNSMVSLFYSKHVTNRNELIRLALKRGLELNRYDFTREFPFILYLLS